MISPVKMIISRLLTVDPYSGYSSRWNFLRKVFPEESLLGTRYPVHLIHLLISSFSLFPSCPYNCEIFLLSFIIYCLSSSTTIQGLWRKETWSFLIHCNNFNAWNTLFFYFYFLNDYKWKGRNIMWQKKPQVYNCMLYIKAGRMY